MTQGDALGAVEVRGSTRQSFILGGAIAAGATLGLGAVAPFVSSALSASPSSDIDVLNFALTLEYLEASLYTVKAKTVGLIGAAASYTSRFGHEETRHVAALTKAIVGLGGKPAAVPSFVFPPTNPSAFLALAYTLENLGVGAYNGALPRLQSPAVLAVAGSIVQVEARHAATIGLLANKSVTPNGAFDTPLSASEVLATTRPLSTGVTGG
jgi:hypothetical protein